MMKIVLQQNNDDFFSILSTCTCIDIKTKKKKQNVWGEFNENNLYHQDKNVQK